MTTKQYEDVKRQIETAKKESMRLEVEKENIEKGWKADGINSIEDAKKEMEKLNDEIKILEEKETVLMKQLEDSFDWNEG
jgi:predicted transcriptional regulator